MAISNNPLAPNPETNMDNPRFEPEIDPEDPKEDLGKGVPVGEPDDEGYVIKEEDREYGLPDKRR